jgi:imidazolonepropionase
MTGADLLLTNCRAATLAPGSPYGLVEDAAIAMTDGRIAWVGAAADAPSADRTERLDGRLVTPGLIDPHTHLVFGGDRVGEFAARSAGATYAEIAAAGGGILSTVRATRAADEAELTRTALAECATWPPTA